MELMLIENGTKVIGVTIPWEQGGYTFSDDCVLERDSSIAMDMDDDSSVCFRIVSGQVEDETGTYKAGEGLFLDASDFKLAE